MPTTAAAATNVNTAGPKMRSDMQSAADASHEASTTKIR